MPVDYGGLKKKKMKNNTKNLWKGITAILFATIMIASVSVCEGNGTSENPYQITNCTALQNMKNDLSANYILMNDIDCTYDTQDSNGALYNGGQGFAPIGTFTGTFDGQNHIITGLYINRPSGDNVALFARTSNSAEIKNIGLVNVNIKGDEHTGGLVGWNCGGISNSYATGSVNGGYRNVGGFVGINNRGVITNSYATVSVSGNARVGGLVGNNDRTITDCYATGDVSASAWYVGGLVGITYGGAITNCYATGDVSGTAVGGLVGASYSGAITNCYATGAVSGFGGGLLGYMKSGTITNNYWYNNRASCCGAGTCPDCTKASDYSDFYEHCNAPMDVWDFFTTPIWGTDEISPNTDYSCLYWEDGCGQAAVCCIDNDGDGYNVTGGICGPIDCDDTDSNVNPGATEVCNGIDDDCDGTIDQISCDDANPCTTDDVCTAGVCAGTLICAGTDTSCGCEECIDCDAQDGWYDTGPTKWVDDLGNFCEEKEQKEQEYRDYSCSGYECVYTVTGTQWVDTDETRNTPDGTPCDDADPCTSNDVCTAGVCSGTQVVIGPMYLKEQAVADLEAAKTGDKKTDKKIDDAIKHIQNSMDDKLWADELHLDTKHGNKVFDEEKKAVKDITGLCKCKGIEDMTLKYTGTSTVDIRAYDKGDTMIAEVLGASNGDTTIFIDGTTLAKGKLGTETTVKIFVSGTETVIDTQKIHTSCSKPLDEGMTFGDLEVIEVSKIGDLEDCPSSDIIKKLVQADEGLAKTAIDDAKATTVTDPKKQDKVDKEIANAEEELVKAEDELNKGKPDKAIDHYKKAWEHAQKAIEHAQK
jgi:hypothetical protein